MVETTDTRCPQCGSDTGIERERGTLPGGLHPSELEILLRNEWRRRIGPGGYDRAHEIRLIRTLVRAVSDPSPSDSQVQLEHELNRLVADLAALGEGRLAVRREVRRLVRAMRTVLLRAGANGFALEAFVAAAHQALQQALRYPVARRREGTPACPGEE